MKINPLFQEPNAVFILRVPLAGRVNWQDFRRAGFQALDSLGLHLEGEKVVFKPNVTSGEHLAKPDTGITTHPGFLHGMIDYLSNGGTPVRRMTIVEDPRDSDDNHPRHWRGTGYEKLSQESGVRLHCPTTYTCVKKPVFEPQVFSQLNVSRLAVAENTVLINVPKLKTHNLGITSLALKNLMGLVNVFDRHYCHQAWHELPEAIRHNDRPRREWFDQDMHAMWQTGLARRLVDTARVLQPALNIIEGVVGREGTGFQRGANHALGLVIAGVNLAAVDSAASYLMGFDPQEIVYLRLAEEAGIGPTDIRQIKFYYGQAGKIELCPDPATLRVPAPFRVITNTLDEAPVQFDSEETIVDPSETFFGKTTLSIA